MVCCRVLFAGTTVKKKKKRTHRSGQQEKLTCTVIGSETLQNCM